MIWELLYSSACLQSVEIDDCMLCAPTSTHLLPLTHPGPCRLCQPSPSAEGAAGTSRVSAAARLFTVPGAGQTVLFCQSRLSMDGQENPLSTQNCSEAQGYVSKGWWGSLQDGQASLSPMVAISPGAGGWAGCTHLASCLLFHSCTILWFPKRNVILLPAALSLLYYFSFRACKIELLTIP